MVDRERRHLRVVPQPKGSDEDPEPPEPEDPQPPDEDLGVVLW
jgi:hypothetical protein